MKLVIRADDVGYSAVNDIGAFEALEQGVATAADVMLDAPHAPQALERLRQMPWISVGWHPHFWCSPVLVFGYGMSSRVSATLFATARWTIMSRAIRRATQACL